MIFQRKKGKIFCGPLLFLIKEKTALVSFGVARKEENMWVADYIAQTDY